MKKQLRHLRAFSLVEVAIALGLVVFCLVILMGLIPVGLNSNHESLQETQAASLASSIMSDLRVTTNSGTPLATNFTSPYYGITIPAPGGNASVTLPAITLFMKEDGTSNQTATAADVRYRVDLGFKPPTSGRAATMVRVLVSWPPQSAPANTWPTNSLGVFETTTALNCN